jgi:hypothetical protein
MDEARLGGLIFIGVGGLGVLAALLLYLRGRKFLRTALSAQGTVVENVASSGGEGGTVYQPVIDFTTAEGQQVRFTGSVASSPPKYQPGQVVAVKYSPTNPQKARLPGIFGMWFLPLLFGVLGVAFAGGGVLWMSTVSSEGGDADPPAVVGTAIPGLPSGAPGSVAVPDVGTVLTVQDGSGAGRVTSATCDALRESGKKAREVELSFDAETLVLRLKPYKGPGAYLPGQTAEIGGSFFSDGAAVSGAVIIEASETSGVVNLVAGNRSVSGAWDCSEA